MRKILFLITAVLSAILLLAELAEAGSCKEPDKHHIHAVTWQHITSGLVNPVHVNHAGDGSGDLYLVEQRGSIQRLHKGRLAGKPFLDIRRKVSSGDERGLLSVAFHPRYKGNGRIFVNYTSDEGGLHTRISEFRRGRNGMADNNSERILLRIKQPYVNHNGGQIAFGPDGYLYIGMGDGGKANDPQNNGQNTKTLLGAILRVDINSKSPGKEYGIPGDNPFANGKDGAPEVYAWGMRNPWRFSFDRDNGRLYVADVGQDELEEISIAEKGKNYGWRIMEGSQCNPDITRRCNTWGLEFPIHVYRHPAGFSITGGHVYRGKAIPGLCGTYLFGDYVTKKLWGLRYDGKKVRAVKELEPGANLSISSFGEDEDGEVYGVDHKKGELYRLAKRK